MFFLIVLFFITKMGMNGYLFYFVLHMYNILFPWPWQSTYNTIQVITLSFLHKMTNYLYTIRIGDISRNQDNKDNLIQNIHAYAWKICNTWYFWYCLVGWSSSNPAEKSISLTPWHYIVKINFVRITKMYQIHVSKSWLVSEQYTINITHKCIYIYLYLILYSIYT